MTLAEREMLNQLHARADAYDGPLDDLYDMDFADKKGPGARRRKMAQQRRRAVAAPRGAQLRRAKGNPSFTAQVDLNTVVQYFTLTGGVYTAVASGALDPGLQVGTLASFYFGASDLYGAAYKRAQAEYNQINPNWSYAGAGVWGVKDFSDLALDATVTSTLQLGDVVVFFTSALPGAGTTSLAAVIVRSSQVAFGKLVESTNSDTFVINTIRYSLPSNTVLQQFDNQIGTHIETLFGKFQSDFISPTSFKNPEQQQDTIIDIPLVFGIDKNSFLASYVEWNVGSYLWSIFIQKQDKLRAE